MRSQAGKGSKEDCNAYRRKIDYVLWVRGKKTYKEASRERSAVVVVVMLCADADLVIAVKGIFCLLWRTHHESS